MFIQVCLFLLLLIKCYGYQSTWNSDHNDHRIPQDVMVDVVNNLALKLLMIHNEGNDNNVAVSPYGALSVLVALEEGLRGNAANEIQQAAHIPSDLSVVRIGLRDIHRHLKSYFIPEEGFLSGLTLSHDNVTLHREYEDILRFYGFDIDSFNSALYAGLFTTEKITSTTDEIPTTSTEIITSTTEVPVSTTEIVSSTTETDTGSTETDTGSTETSTGSTETSTVAITSTENISEKEGNHEMTTEITNATATERVTSTTAVETTTSMANEEITTEQKTTEILTTSTNTENSATTFTPLLTDGSTLNIMASTEMTQSTDVTSAELPSTTQAITPNTETTSSELPSSTQELIQTTEPASSDMTISTTEATSTTELSTVEMTSTTEVTSTTFETTVSSIPTTATADVNVSTENEMNIENFSDEKIDKQNDGDTMEDSDVTTDDLVEIIDQLTESIEKMNEREETTEMIEKSDHNSESHKSAISIEGIIDLKQNNNYDEISKYSNNSSSNDTLRRNTRSLVDYIMARYYDDHFITQRPPPYNSESDLFFLINGKYREYGINYMTYDTVLPFYYVSHLNTLALRFPLDSSKYYLLLLLPESSQNINKLICDMRLNTSLKHIIDNLRYTYVKAIIPSFMLKGYVILTSSFQRMGIRQVFEPRQADFSPMTGDKGIYVTNIEQAITVNIRNYVDPVTMNNNKYLHRTNPVLFKANHPFLYFVIDSEIDVTLMAGKIVNPLNSRIR